MSAAKGNTIIERIRRAWPLAVAGLAWSAGAAAQQSAVLAEDARRHVGQNALVCGTVDKVRFAENSEGSPTFLYMGGKFPRHTFSVRIPGSVRGQFQPAPEELEGQDVCAQGEVRRDASRAEIEVAAAGQLKLAKIK